MLFRILLTKLSLLLAVCLTAAPAQAQDVTAGADRKVVGIWVQRLDADSPVQTEELPRSLFIFGADHYYTQVPDTSVTDARRIAGTWEVTPDHLTLKATAPADSLLREPIVWVTDDLFYTTGREDANGASVFAYFQRVNGRLKRRLQLKGMLKEARQVQHP